ncbi:MAG: alpha/beta hydrolase [Halobacteria archaeon]
MPFVKSGDCNIHYEVFGSGPAMVWHHGFSSCGKFWLQFVGELPGRHILVDARGHGYSDPSKEEVITAAAMAEDVLRILDAEGADRAVVLGHSMGGIVAQELTLRHPDRVRGLILAGTLPSAPMLGFKARLSANRILKYARFLAKPVVKAVIRITEPWLTLEQADMVMDEFYRCDFRTLWAIGRGLRRFDALDRLGQIKVPTLVLVGAGDKLTPPKVNEEIHRRIPGSEFVVLPESGHWVPLERPREFTGAIRKLLDRLTSP